MSDKNSLHPLQDVHHHQVLLAFPSVHALQVFHLHQAHHQAPAIKQLTLLLALYLSVDG